VDAEVGFLHEDLVLTMTYSARAYAEDSRGFRNAVVIDQQHKLFVGRKL
jgi:hypothetical protein